MKVYCLASSSSGNCYVMDFDINGNHTLLMVECGIPWSEIISKCNLAKIDISKIHSCLVTHAHGDHCKATSDLLKHGIKVFTSIETKEKIGLNTSVLDVEGAQTVDKGICVFPFLVEHDIEGAIGFVIKTSTETVIFVNDSKKWETNLINFKPDYVFIECNYWQDMVYAQLHELKREIAENQLDDLELKEHNTKIKQHTRNIESHMSLNGCLKGLKKLNLRYCKSIFLMHLSDRYANEYKMKNEVQKQTGVRTYVCGKQGGIH